ncbi:MAG: GntR family transcriptional regulator [Coriobacteriales bacterium]|nr:GntR family transcriptional regulator [Coriobacteriales bacterium]
MNAQKKDKKDNLGPLEQFELDYGSGLPVWIQVKNRLAYLIASGGYAPDERLPTVRALAVALDISYNTVNRAYMDLERDGYISTRQGRGTFVLDIANKTTSAMSDVVGLLADEMIQAGINAGMNDTDIIKMVKKRLSARSRL